MTKTKTKNTEIKRATIKNLEENTGWSPWLIGTIADEVAKTVIKRLPSVLPHPRRRTKKKNTKKIENPVFLDTSAIIDGRIFEVVRIGLAPGAFIILESILLELKHIADSHDTVKRERGRKGLELLETLRKSKGTKVVVLSEEQEKAILKEDIKEVDERLIRAARSYKGKIITCDYNLEKRASIMGVVVVNINTLANVVKITAVPGEVLHIKILHKGKDLTQGVGYLDDGTMIVVENAGFDLEKEVDVIVSRVIQTSAGRMLFAKKI
jgi:uncharacterized protein YacL